MIITIISNGEAINVFFKKSDKIKESVWDIHLNRVLLNSDDYQELINASGIKDIKKILDRCKKVERVRLSNLTKNKA